MKIKVMVTGATGMVGEGVMLTCLGHPDVDQVLVINRKPNGITHPKLKEIIHGDFFNLGPIETHLKGYNACFFCLGVSSVGMSKADYKRTTFDLTLNVARTLAKNNSDMTFTYVTGSGTDSTERGPIAWARVKGATENELMKIFKNAYMFRPAIMKAVAGQKNLKGLYKALEWIYPIGRYLYPSGFCTLNEVGTAMIKCATQGYSKHILEVKDIVELAKS